MKDLSHLFWPFVISFPIIGVLACWIILSCLFRRLVSSRSDSFAIDCELIATARWMHKTPSGGSRLPGEPFYYDLKFSAIRHALAFVLFAVLTRLTNGALKSILSLLNLWYATNTYWRYKSRMDMLRDCREKYGRRHEDISRTEDSLVRHSLVVVVFSFVCVAALYCTWLFASLGQ